MPPIPRCLGSVLAAVLALSGAGCGGGPQLYPVTGKVFHDGKPAEGATVVLQPKDGSADSPKPSGVAGPDGSFTLSTYPHGDGAPAGDYTVLVTWYPPDAREQESPANKLPDAYADVARSPLRATVKDGPTELEPIQIPK